MRMVHCPRCGTENDADDKICAVCSLDLTTISALICPICQYENQPEAQSCRQCGSHLVRLTPGERTKRDRRNNLAPRSVKGNSSNIGEKDLSRHDDSVTAGEDGDEELIDWLTELTESPAPSSDSEDEIRPGTAPLWFKKSESELSQTDQLGEETLPDWLKNLKVTEKPKTEKPPERKRRLPDWLKESGELDESRLQALKPPEIQSVEVETSEEEPEDDLPDKKLADSWLIELAAMGTAELAAKELDDETRFVWDDSALASEVPADLGESAPEWLADLPQIEDTTEQFTDDVVSEWLDKQEELPEQSEVPKDTGTKPLGPTKELSGVPEQLVSPDLPEWLEDQTAAQQQSKTEEALDSQREIQTEEQSELDMGFLDEEPMEELDFLLEEQQETGEELDESSFTDDIQEEPASTDEPLEEEFLTELGQPDSFADHGPSEELALLLNYLDQSPVQDPTSEDDFFELKEDDTLELVIRDLPELMRRPEPAESVDLISEEHVQEAPTQPSTESPDDSTALEIDEHPARILEEVTTNDLPSDAESIPAIPISEAPETTEADTETPREEVPGWLGLLTTKLLDTFDNDFVNEWFSHDKEQAELVDDTAIGQEELAEPEPEPEPEIPKEIDPFFGEVIPDWIAAEEEGASAEDDLLLDEPLSNELGTGEVLSEKEPSAIPGATAAISEEKAGIGVIDSADEWLDLLDSPEDETDLSQFLEDETILRPETIAEKTPVDDSRHDLLPASLLFANDETVADLVDVPVGSLIPISYAAGEFQDFTLTKEQQQQVSLLQQLTSSEPKESRPIAGQVRIGTKPNTRLTIGLALLMIITIGWLVPSSWDLIPFPNPTELSDAEIDLNEAIETSAGDPILIAFDYTPTTAGEMDIVASTVIQQISENKSPVVAVSQFAAGTAMADRVLSDFDELVSYNLGYLPGGPVGLRNLAMCLSGDGSCQSTFGQLQDDEVADALARVGLIVILAADRDSLVDWIEQVGTRLDQDAIAGIIQPLEPILLPYLNSGQVAGAIVGLPSATVYRSEFLSGGDDGFQQTALVFAQWFVIGILILGVIYFGVSGFWSSSQRGADSP